MPRIRSSKSAGSSVPLMRSKGESVANSASRSSSDSVVDCNSGQGVLSIRSFPISVVKSTNSALL